jgi:hypothetical protein
MHFDPQRHLDVGVFGLKVSTNGRQMALSSRDENVKTMLGSELLPITSDRTLNSRSTLPITSRYWNV